LTDVTANSTTTNIALLEYNDTSHAMKLETSDLACRKH